MHARRAGACRRCYCILTTYWKGLKRALTCALRPTPTIYITWTKILGRDTTRLKPSFCRWFCRLCCAHPYEGTHDRTRCLRATALMTAPGTCQLLLRNARPCTACISPPCKHRVLLLIKTQPCVHGAFTHALSTNAFTASWYACTTPLFRNHFDTKNSTPSQIHGLSRL